MNITHHEVKMGGHPHELKMTMEQAHEKMNLTQMGMGQNHDHEVKMTGHPHQNHELKMMEQAHEKMNLSQMTMGQHEVKMLGHESLHHEPLVQPHMMEVSFEPQEMPAMDFKINNVQNVSNPEPPQTQPQPEPESKKSKIDKKKKEAIDGQAREVIFKVIKFFESEKQNRGYAFPVENVVKRACAATGLSESTIKRIKRDGLRAEATQTRMTGPKKKRVRKTKVQLDYFQLCALRGIVNGYSVRKEVPTLGKILAAAKHELNYRGGKESLRLILLNKLGIKFKKCEKKNAKKPPEQASPPVQQMQNIMPQQPMQHMKVMEPQCVYTNMIPPVSY